MAYTLSSMRFANTFFDLYMNDQQLEKHLVDCIIRDPVFLLQIVRFFFDRDGIWRLFEHLLFQWQRTRRSGFVVIVIVEVVVLIFLLRQVTTQILMTLQYQNARPFHKFGKPFSIVKGSSFLECFGNDMLIKLKPDDPESLQVETSSEKKKNP